MLTIGRKDAMLTRFELVVFWVLTVSHGLWAWYLASCERPISWGEVFAPFASYALGLYLVWGITPALYWKFRRWRGKQLLQSYR